MVRLCFFVLIFFSVLIRGGAQNWQPVQYANGTSPLARHENGFAEVNGKFYLIGGRGIKSVNIFDPVTRIWTSGAAPPIELHHFQAVVYQNKIYAICALTGAYPAETPVSQIYIYDPALNVWTQGATIPIGRRRGSAGVTLFNNKFYIVSGIQDGHQSGWVAWTDEYDPATGIWTVLPDAPQARDHFHAGLINGQIYCAGGRRTSQPNFAANTISAVDVFDIASQTWSTPTQLPTPSGAPAVAVVNNELVVAGGEVDYQSNALSNVQSFNPLTNIWTSRPNLNVGRHATQFIYHSGTLYIAAGSTSQGGSGENNTMASAPFGNPGQAGVSFNTSKLTGANPNNPTTLAFGPDNRLYVTQVDGTIFAYTIQKSGPNNYSVSNTETINLIENIPNHNDKGAVVNLGSNRQVTGIVATGTAANPVLYICSSDPRIGGGGELGDLNLDTNSGIISKLTKNGSTWSMVHVVTGLPRSEENHASNGLSLDETNNILYLAQGGNTNGGSPSVNFGLLGEYALAAAILEIDLDMINNQFGGSYTLPTLDDPTRANNPNGTDVGDPFGGNDGLNQAKLIIGGPVQIYASGFRLSYDLVVTKTPGKAGRMYTIVNGGNPGWGGYPENEGQPNVTNNRLLDEPGSTGPTLNDDQINNLDGLHFITGRGYYGGHPVPIRANPAGAGWYWFDNDTNQGHFELNPTVDWPPYPVSLANPVESDFRNHGVDDGSLYTWSGSTNGIAEYTSTAFFNGAMTGNLLAASWDSGIHRIELTEDGTAVTRVTKLFSGFGNLPLDVIAQGDGQIFPGTIWSVVYGETGVTVFEPAGSQTTCSGDINNFNLDDDGDGYSNGDETLNNTDPCSPSSKPADFDLDLISNLLDPNDDNDAFNDIIDKFALDANNGKNTSLPIDYPFLNGDPGFGLFGLGLTGLMTNSVDSYENNFDVDDPGFIAGGAVGALSVPAQTGDAVTNNQKYAFQFGVPISQSVAAFTLHSRLLGSPFFDGATGSDLGTQSNGIYFGNGDQNNYFKFVLHANNGNPGFQILVEQNGSIVNQQMIPVANILSSAQLDLFIDVNAVTGAAQCRYQNSSTTTPVNVGQSFTVSGNLLSLLVNDTDAVAVGVIASCGNKTPFSATWDFMQVTTTTNPTTLTNVIRINSGGTAQNFGGEAWVADQNFTGGTVYSTTNPIANTTQDPIYQTERFGNFSYAIPVGQAGTYAVDLHLAEIYFGAIGQRTFNINIENGQFVRNNFDIIQTYGANNAAFVLRADNLNITDGTINITFSSVVNNAKVSGIAVGRYSTSPVNTPPVVAQAPAPQSVPNTQATVVLQLEQIFNDDGGVNNLTFSVQNNTNQALLTNTQIVGTQITFTLSGTTGTGTITLRATDASNAFVETTFQLTVTPPGNTAPVVVQAPAPQSVPNTQATVVLQLGQIFNDDGGVNNLTFSVQNNTNPALLSNTQIVGTQITFTLSGTTGTGTITLRATDASNAFVQTTFQLTVTSEGTPTLTNVIRINSGGTAQNFGGEAWVADQNFTGGTVYSTTNPIANTTQDPIYQTERFGNFSYAIPVGQAGTYAVDLHLAEIYFGAIGQRTFNINIENGQFVRNNFDIIQTYGANNAAFVLRADNLNITDGTINITFSSVVNNAKVSGIAVGRYSTSPVNTPPVVAQAPAPQSVPNTQATVVLQLEQIFNDDGGVNNLTFSVQNNTNQALLTNTQIVGTQITFTLSGTTGTGTITLRATDASNAFVETTFQLTVTPPGNTAPVVVQAPAPQSVPNTQATVVLQLGQIFNDDGGVNNLTFSVQNNTNPALLSNTQIVGTQITFTLSGTTGTGTITLRATDASNAFVQTTFQLTVTSEGTPTLTNVIRINSGGTAQNFGGEAWVADQNFTGGTVYSTTNPIANTTQDPIYQTERFGDFSYAIPVGQAGTYAVDLHLAEIYFGAIGQRTFNINIENGQFVRNNFDIIQTYGANNAAFVLRADNLNITDGTINITFSSVVNNAKVSGIAVGRYSTSPVNTPPVVTQAPAPQSVPNTQATVVLQLEQIFNDDGGVNNLTFSVQNNTNQALLTNTQIVGTQITFTLSGTTGTGTITLRATDASNAFVETTFQLTVTPPGNTAPVVVQAPAPQSVPNTQATVVLQLGQIFNDDGGVNNLTFSVQNNTNPALLSNTQIVGTQITFTLSGTTGTGTITLRATDASNAFVQTTFQLTVTSEGTPTLTNVIRINSGGTAQNFGGEAWVADQNFTGGTVYSTTNPIANTTQDPIYQTERFGDFSYAIPVGQAGTYAVDLHLAEIYFGAIGQRTFNINIENGQFVRNNFDIIQTYGANNAAFVLRADNLNITDGTINITFSSVVNNAKISGIAVGRYSSGSARMAIGHEPIVEKPKDVTIHEGQAWNYQVKASDPDDDQLWYSTTGLPASLYINKETGLINGTIEVNSNTFPVTLNVSDGSGLTTEVRFTITVAPAKPLATDLADLKFVVYPNPAQHDHFYVKVEVKQRQRWNFVLMDFAGRQISLGSFDLDQGVQVLPFDITAFNLAKGLYYLAVQNGQTKKNVKLAIK